MEDSQIGFPCWLPVTIIIVLCCGCATAVVWAIAGCKHAEATDADHAGKLRGPGLRRIRPVRMTKAEIAKSNISSSDPRKYVIKSSKPEARTVEQSGSIPIVLSEARTHLQNMMPMHSITREATLHRAKCATHTQHSSAHSSKPSRLIYVELLGTHVSKV